MVEECTSAFSSLGKSEWSMQSSEAESRRLRRSLYIIEDVNEGDEITQNNVRAIRPGLGLSPKYLPDMLGKHFTKTLKRGTPMSAEFFK